MSIQHKDIPEAQLHEPKGVSTASFGDVYIADGAASGAWTKLYQGFQNIVEVKSVSDFPTPIAGVITPAANTAYYISGHVDIAPNVIEITNPGTSLIGFNRSTDVLSTSSPSALISSTNENVILDGFSLTNLDVGGTLLNLQDNDSHTLVLTSLVFGKANSIGTIGDFIATIFDNCALIPQQGTGGVTFTGTAGQEILVRDSVFNGWTGTMFDLGVSQRTFLEFVNVRFVNVAAPATIAIDGLPNGGNTPLGLGIISGCLFTGMTNPLGANIDHADSGWFMRSTVGTQESSFFGYTSMAGNLTPTVVAGSSIWTKVAGTTVPSPNNERFAQTANNEITANVLLPRPIQISATISAGKAGGGTRTLEFTVFKDSGSGFAILNPDAISVLETDNNVRGTALIVSDIANPGDKYSIYCQNLVDAAAIEVPSMQFSIRG